MDARSPSRRASWSMPPRAFPWNPNWFARQARRRDSGRGRERAAGSPQRPGRARMRGGAVPAREGRVDPRILMELLWQRFSLDSLIVEGGPTLLGSPFRRRFGRSRPSLHCAQDFRRLRSFGPRGGARGGGSGGCARPFRGVPADDGRRRAAGREASAMFTGIVEEVGRVRFLRGGSQRRRATHCRQAGFGRCATGRLYRSQWCVSDGDGLRRRLFHGRCHARDLRRSNLGMLRAGAPSIWSALWRPTGASGAISYRAISTVWARLPRCARRRTPCGTR